MSCDHCSPAAGCAGCGSLSLGAKRGNGLVFALVGQPNSGKSTLFNGLTGSHQHVGNWPGKTVEQKVGEFELSGKKNQVVDLPGAYSLTANSPEEEVTHDFLISGDVDAALVVVDASQLERSLFILARFCGLRPSNALRAGAQPYGHRRAAGQAHRCEKARVALGCACCSVWSPPMRSTTAIFSLPWSVRFPGRLLSIPLRSTKSLRRTMILFKVQGAAEFAWTDGVLEALFARLKKCIGFRVSIR